MVDFCNSMEDALRCYQSGNLPQAELLCRYIVASGASDNRTWELLGVIALDVGAYEFANEYFQRSIRLSPGSETAKKKLALAEDLQRRQDSKLEIACGLPEPASVQTDRYLLIKAWGYGFWSDVNHVLGMLLLAEMTGRTPVVHWGDNCLFIGRGCENAFEQFFEPVSTAVVADLLGNNYQFYPPKWSEENLFTNDVNKWEGQHSRMAGLYYLNREEEVLVSDFHTKIIDLVPWISHGHPLYGCTPAGLYRYLFSKYFKLKPGLADDVEDFWSNHLSGRNVLAVHVRGSDKGLECDGLDAINQGYRSKVDRCLLELEDSLVFLLTDSAQAVEEYKGLYGNRLVTTECNRTAGTVGIHHQTHEDRAKLAREVLLDTCLAARCARFIGNGESSVSTMVQHMKKWGEGECLLLGNNRWYQPNFFLHNR